MSPRRVLVACLSILVWSSDCSVGTAGQSAAGGTDATASVRFASGEAALGIPFRLVDDQIVVPVRVNDALTVDMILDTGLGFDGAMLLDVRLGMQLGLTKYAQTLQLGGGGAQTPRTVGLATGATLGLPGVTLGNRALLVVQDSTSVAHWHAAGIIGRALMGAVVEIDFQKRVLNLSRSLRNTSAAPREEYRITFEQGVPAITATVVTDRGREIPVRLLVDTGANAALLLRAASLAGLGAPERLIRPVGGVLAEGINGPMRGSVGRVGRLTFGSVVLDRVLTRFVEEADVAAAFGQRIDGMIGNEILRRFNVVLDYANHRMFLRAGQQSAQAFDFDMAGLVLQARRDGRFSILDVIAGSPAARAGVAGGDLLTAIDGRDVQSLGSEQTLGILKTAGRTVELTLERDRRQYHAEGDAGEADLTRTSPANCAAGEHDERDGESRRRNRRLTR